ncbi:putative cytochrome P450 hydroxylase [[Actinomadura] parvosata subsp. kistnae]|uniref:Cytochrome n=1 Tax=[Actinomadura] parvosata subsp. kistnae TaxID=1909395 RepID=A0A1V0AI08_9ACTN|nr:cytochrome P450 [Nonomuraea sp. ATCC 55076]AQZ69861.1 cytochrome [Nonomuraea sp. ATCC 55076]SPL90173.1 putative cytochrome P450 hydroxylase [Actinomadura parvosata subsp. kistnae]
MSVLDFDLSDRDFWARPMSEREEAFERLRSLGTPAFFEEAEMAYMPKGPGYYALVRHADILEASRNPEVFCSGDGGATNIPDMPAEFAEYFGSMINMDDPRHARLRRIVSRAFTPKMIKQFESDVEAAAVGIVDDLLAKGPGCDFVTEVAARLPLKIICDMMGIPERDYQFVFDRSNIILGGFDPEYTGGDLDQLAERLLNAGMELQQLVQDLAAHRADHPTGDLTSSLVNANIDGERLTMQELGSFFILLVVAGNETTRNAISYGMRLLTKNPDQRALWLEDIDGRAPGAVEEIVRLASPVNFMRRKTTRDFEMNGHLYRKGQKVVLFYWAANRDASVFDDPLRFDITRHPNPHVGYGGPGPHFCLGAHLARREITVMFRELLRRVPGIEAGKPDRLHSSFINGIKHMECTF